ncbi:AraC family transcriptional regulator [Xylophilus sp. GW821-FHT01B05]
MNDLRKTSTIEINGASGVPKTGRTAPIDIVFLVFEGFQPIDLAGPWQAFSTANDELGHARYRLRTCGTASVAASTDAGLRLQVDLDLEQSLSSPMHTVIVPGGEGIHRASSDPQMLDWVRAQDALSQRTCSVCTGAFLLAAAGLLDGCRVTTHWRSAAQLQGRFPKLIVNDELIFCQSTKYWTTAGVSAGIDLALTLIENDCGARLAQKVARRLVVYLRRGGDQRQYSQTLRAQDRAEGPFSELVGQMEARLSHAWSIDEMADICNMSRRTFQRKFKSAFGIPALEVLNNLRAERREVVQRSGRHSQKQMDRLLQDS